MFLNVVLRNFEDLQAEDKVEEDFAQDLIEDDFELIYDGDYDFNSLG